MIRATTASANTSTEPTRVAAAADAAVAVAVCNRDDNDNDNDNSNSNTNHNPLKDDPQLRRLLLELDKIETKKEFRRWRASFLEQLEKYYDQQHCVPALARYQMFTKSMGSMSHLVKKLYGYLEAGNLTLERTTVRARKCLTDLQQQLECVNTHLFDMLPKTAEQEKKLGYSKFHLGAVLVRDGFVEYDRLVICDEILKHMRENGLSQVADRQVLDNMEHYHNRLGMFCDVMADLGLYKVMLKCRELLQNENENEQDDKQDKQDDQQIHDPIETSDEVFSVETNEKETTEQIKQVEHTVTPKKVTTPPSSRPSSPVNKERQEIAAKSPLVSPSKKQRKPQSNTTASGKFELQINDATTTLAQRMLTTTQETLQNEKATKPPENVYNKFGHYYQGNNDWRIAATIKRERADKEQQKQEKGESQGSKPTTTATKPVLVANSNAGKHGTPTRAIRGDHSMRPSLIRGNSIDGEGSETTKDKDQESSTKPLVRGDYTMRPSLMRGNSVDGQEETDEGPPVQNVISDTMTREDVGTHDEEPHAVRGDYTMRPSLTQGTSIDGENDTKEEKGQEQADKAPPLHSVNPDAATVEDLGMESVHANLLSSTSHHQDDPTTDSEDDDSSDTNSLDLTVVSKDWGRLDTNGPDGRPKIYRALSGIKPEQRALLVNEPPKRRGGKRPSLGRSTIANGSEDPTKQTSTGAMSPKEIASSEFVGDAISAMPLIVSQEALARSKEPDEKPGREKKHAEHHDTPALVCRSPPVLEPESAVLLLPLQKESVKMPGKERKHALNDAPAVAVKSQSSSVPETTSMDREKLLETEGSTMPNGEKEVFGYSVTVSRDGSMLAAGSPRGEGTKGRARAFYWNETNRDWAQMGQDLIGKAPGDAFGTSVAMSADGKILAVGSPQLDKTVTEAGYVCVYRYNQEDNYWTTMGTVILGLENGDTFGWSVSLSGNGETLVAGGPQSRNHLGVVRIFQWAGDVWKERGGDLRGDSFGRSVAICTEGNLVATGCNEIANKNFNTFDCAPKK